MVVPGPITTHRGRDADHQQVAGWIPLLEIRDDIDHAAAEEFHASASAALDGRHRLVLDLSGCRYVDSGGLAVILSLTRRSALRGCWASSGATGPRTPLPPGGVSTPSRGFACTQTSLRRNFKWRSTAGRMPT